MKTPIYTSAILCLAYGAMAWVPARVHWGARRVVVPSSRTLRMLSSRPTPNSSPSVQERNNAFAQRLLVQGSQLLQDTLQVLRETGLRAPAMRSLQAGVAVAETLREVAKELAQYQQGAAKDPPSTARSLRVLFERLGATYIKLGQFIASSPTVFPPEYVLEFQKCLDKTDAIPWEVMRPIIESGLGGRTISDVFDYINPVPLASASIAQVYAGRLRSGDEVAIKVQKPGVEDTLKADLGFIYIASRVLEIVAPELARTSLSDIVADIRTSILEEVDFEKEAKHIEEFRSFLQTAELTQQATCPRVYSQFSSKRVLVMERLRGASLIDLESIRKYTNDPEGALITALNTWSLSIVMAPSFHADLHAGNLLVLEDGRVGFIDFGIVGRLPPKIFQGVSQLVEGIYVGDFNLMAQGLIRVGATSGQVNEARLAEDLRMLFDRVQGLDPQLVMVADPEGVAAAVTIDEEQVTRLLLEMVDVANKNGLKLPREFGLLLKQSLYFNRYIKLLTPDLDVMRDSRVQFPRGDDFIDIRPLPDQ